MIAARHVERAAQVRPAVRRRDPPERLAEERLLLGERRQELRLLVEGDEDGSVVDDVPALEPVDDLARLVHREGEPRLPVRVDRLHRGRTVDEDDVVALGQAAQVRDRPREGREDRGEHEELEEEEEVHAQPLERRVDAQVLEGLLPEERARDGDLAALELEEVEDHERAEERGRRVDPPHVEEVERAHQRTSPRSRRKSSTSRSNGSAVEAVR